MKSKAFIAALGISLAGPAFADPVLGTYQTQPGDSGNYAHVEIYQCDANICGVIRKAFNGSGSPIKSDTVGKRMIWGMKPQGGGKYAKGKIWAPDRDKTYSSKMELNGSSLKVSGCVIGICRAQTWRKVN
ncbi:MAG: DUF2147 domain-containing protein [Paracoccaceae bacterium]|nr:DUF2147 domain-containing protein [Paracoccaceae bacterium]